MNVMLVVGAALGLVGFVVTLSEKKTHWAVGCAIMTVGAWFVVRGAIIASALP